MTKQATAAQQTPAQNIFALRDQLDTAQLLGNPEEVERLTECIRLQMEAEDRAYIAKDGSAA